MDTMYVDLDEHAVNSQGVRSIQTVASDPQLIALRKRVLLKTLWAAFKTGLDLPESTCPVNAFGFHQRSFDLHYVFKISGLSNQWPWIQLFFTLKNYKLSLKSTAYKVPFSQPS
jgi:hypothetical protein